MQYTEGAERTATNRSPRVASARWIQCIASHPRGPLWLGFLAAAFCMPAVTLGFQADDYILLWKFQSGSQPWGLFEFAEGSLSPAREAGVLAWWTSPHFRASFLRPLASLSHALEFTFWPEAPWLMLTVNALIYGGCVTLAAVIYRRVLPAAASATLAALFFAVAYSHALSVGWISGRNALLGLLFSLASLRLQLRARDHGKRAAGLASTTCVVLALLSGEAGTWSLALLLAYALTMEHGSARARLRTITPQLVVGVGWAASYRALGFGVKGASLYRDLSSPASTFTQGILDLPVWTTSLLGSDGSLLALLYPSGLARLLALPAALSLLWLVSPPLRTSKECRFLALSTLLCLVPLSLTIPNARMLLGPSFGALGWIGCVIGGASAGASRRASWRRSLLLGVHLVMAVLLFPISLGAPRAFEQGTRALAAAVERGRDVVLVQSPVELLPNYALMSLWRRESVADAPRTLHQLYAGASELWLQRVDEQTIDLTAVRGWGYTPMERLFCAPEDMPRAGTEIRLQAMSIRVLESTADGMPMRVRFRFPSRLESPERQWLIWQDSQPVPWRPPAVGEGVRLPALSPWRLPS